jgi:hypothetical protein
MTVRSFLAWTSRFPSRDRNDEQERRLGTLATNLVMTTGEVSSRNDEAIAFNRKIVEIARRNIDAIFDLATSLAAAENLADIVQRQSAFWREQFSVLTAQAEKVRALSTSTTADADESIRAKLARRHERDA